MTDAIALESCQPHLHELSNAFSKRALTPNRDYAGRHVDTALFVNQEKLACLQNACADRCPRKRLHQWLASERSAISVFNLQLQSLDQSLKSLTVEGRGSRFTSGRKRDVERIRASMITVRDDALKDYKRKNLERVLRKISERLPVEVLELFLCISSVDMTQPKSAQICATDGGRHHGSIVAKALSAASLKYLRKLDLLNAQISEPKDTVFLRILSDHLVAVEDLKLRVIALRWSTLQHILILVSGSSNAQHGKTFSLKKLALKGSMEAYNKPTSMIKAKEVLRNLECFDLDFTEASGTGEIRNKTISGAVWIFRNIGNVEMNSIRVEANVRLGEDAIEAFLIEATNLAS
ncbi:hypothetical protein BC829DRAFT_442545 [Chytridium lagenaria]|nr:hypothetical protein BC829DRAFT_442545 [Chytridium lagenaria]